MSMTFQHTKVKLLGFFLLSFYTEMLLIWEKFPHVYKTKNNSEKSGKCGKGITAIFSVAASGSAENCSYLLVEAPSSSQSFNAVYQYFIKVPQIMKYFYNMILLVNTR